MNCTQNSNQLSLGVVSLSQIHEEDPDKITDDAKYNRIGEQAYDGLRGMANLTIYMKFLWISYSVFSPGFG